MRLLHRFIAAAWTAMAFASAAVSYQWIDITPAPGGSSDAFHAQVSDVGIHVLGGNRLIVLGGFLGYPVMYSDDGGRSWNPPATPLPGYVAAMFLDVARPGVVYLRTTSYPSLVRGPDLGRLYRSEDFGRTWSVVYTMALADSIAPFATDPLVPHGIYGLYQQYYIGNCIGSCLRSRNEGITRTRNDGMDWSAPLVAAPGFVEGPTPSAPTRLFSGSVDTVTFASTGTLVSVDSGATWSRADTAAPSPLRWIRPDPLRANVLYGYRSERFDSHQLMRSDDGGGTWREIFLSSTTAPNLTIDPAHPNVLWMPYRTDAIYRSENRGDTWQQVPYPYQDLPPNYDPGATLVTSPGEPGVVYLVRFRRLYRGVPTPAPDPVVVEFQYEGDRYWSTSLDGEAVSQDYRQQPGDVHRTGLRWGAWRSEDAPAGALGSCRFWPMPGVARTRVLVQQGFECDALKRSPGWILEGENEFFTLAPTNNACPAGTVAVHRFHNLKPDFNHRWVADPAAIAEMGARGWYDEGVRFCGRPLQSNE